MRLFWLVALCLLVTAGSASAQDTGSLLVRGLSQELGIETKAEITWLRQKDDWIIACGRPLNVDGTPVDYRLTLLSEEAAEGLIDDRFCALFRDRPDGMTMLELDVAATDAPLFDWMDQYDLPAGMLGD